jgi:hypothetical protein
MVTDTGYFQLVGDSSASEYDTYKYRFPRKALYDFQAYYGLYGIPIDDLYKAWLKYGGYIGSPLGRSNEDLYNTCLLHARYTYECQNGGQR